MSLDHRTGKLGGWLGMDLEVENVFPSHGTWSVFISADLSPFYPCKLTLTKSLLRN